MQNNSRCTWHSQRENVIIFAISWTCRGRRYKDPSFCLAIADLALSLFGEWKNCDAGKCFNIFANRFVKVTTQDVLSQNTFLQHNGNVEICVISWLLRRGQGKYREKITAYGELFLHLNYSVWTCRAALRSYKKWPECLFSSEKSCFYPMSADAATYIGQIDWHKLFRNVNTNVNIAARSIIRKQQPKPFFLPAYDEPILNRSQVNKTRKKRRNLVRCHLNKTETNVYSKNNFSRIIIEILLNLKNSIICPNIRTSRKTNPPTRRKQTHLVEKEPDNLRLKSKSQLSGRKFLRSEPILTVDPRKYPT